MSTSTDRLEQAAAAIDKMDREDALKTAIGLAVLNMGHLDRSQQIDILHAALDAYRPVVMLRMLDLLTNKWTITDPEVLGAHIALSGPTIEEIAAKKNTRFFNLVEMLKP
ncbi:MAG: hypothetical protein V4773_16665 [Verrucomicrobiota bacterium]